MGEYPWSFPARLTPVLSRRPTAPPHAAPCPHQLSCLSPSPAGTGFCSSRGGRVAADWLTPVSSPDSANQRAAVFSSRGRNRRAGIKGGGRKGAGRARYTPVGAGWAGSWGPGSRPWVLGRGRCRSKGVGRRCLHKGGETEWMRSRRGRGSGAS